MDSSMFNSMHSSICLGLAILVIVCILIGVGMTIGLPMLWSLIKPWLHAITG
jgi:hypothetical protein